MNEQTHDLLRWLASPARWVGVRQTRTMLNRLQELPRFRNRDDAWLSQCRHCASDLNSDARWWRTALPLGIRGR